MQVYVSIKLHNRNLHARACMLALQVNLLNNLSFFYAIIVKAGWICPEHHCALLRFPLERMALAKQLGFYSAGSHGFRNALKMPLGLYSAKGSA